MIMFILGIETSCDETAAAVVEDGKNILSNVVFSQIDIHRKYSGVVPEIASREHTEKINLTIEKALEEANISFSQLSAVAVTFGPGLVLSLIIGMSSAKAISISLSIPLVPVNHLEGHIYSAFLQTENIPLPSTCLLASGGHTVIIHVERIGKYSIEGETLDDAAGECFDKVARILGLGYPGGPSIELASQKGYPKFIQFPRPMYKSNDLNFSFSGLKTAVSYYVKSKTAGFMSLHVNDIAASFQQAVVDILVDKTIKASQNRRSKSVILTGGVAANKLLRKCLKERCMENNINFFTPDFSLCTDNAAMIAGLAYHYVKNSKFSLSLSPQPSLSL